MINSYISLTGNVPESLFLKAIAIKQEYEYGGFGKALNSDYMKFKNN